MEIVYASLTVVLFFYLLRYVRHACSQSVPPRWATYDILPLMAALLLTVMLTVAAAFAIQGVMHFASSSLISETVAVVSVILMVLAIMAPLLFARRHSASPANDMPAGEPPLVPGMSELAR